MTDNIHKVMIIAHRELPREIFSYNVLIRYFACVNEFVNNQSL